MTDPAQLTQLIALIHRQIPVLSDKAVTTLAEEILDAGWQRPQQRTRGFGAVAAKLAAMPNYPPRNPLHGFWGMGHEDHQLDEAERIYFGQDDDCVGPYGETREYHNRTHSSGPATEYVGWDYPDEDRSGQWM